MDNQQPEVKMAKQKYTKETIKARILKEMPESDIEIIKYNGIVKPAIIHCNKCNSDIEYKTMDKIIDRGRRGLKDACRVCEDTVQLSRRDKQIRKLEEILPQTDFELLTPVKRVKEKSLFRCKKCGATFERNLYEFFKTQKCPYCEGQLHYMTKEKFEQKMKSKNILDYELIGEFKGIDKPTLFRHKSCGFIWKCLPSSILAFHGCPKCKLSRGETRIANWLTLNHISYSIQHKFKNSEIPNYPFDFYLKYNDKQYCIEYQGEQHYKPVNRFGGEQAFQNQLIRDKKKKNFCNNNNIILIEIPYTDFQNIDSILTSWFNDQSKDVDSSESKCKPSKDEDIV